MSHDAQNRVALYVVGLLGLVLIPFAGELASEFGGYTSYLRENDRVYVRENNQRILRLSLQAESQRH